MTEQQKIEYKRLIRSLDKEALKQHKFTKKLEPTTPPMEGYDYIEYLNALAVQRDLLVIIMRMKKMIGEPLSEGRE